MGVTRNVTDGAFATGNVSVLSQISVFSSPKGLESRSAGSPTINAEAGKMLSGGMSLGEIAAKVEDENIDPQPKSGQQEYLEAIVNRHL